MTLLVTYEYTCDYCGKEIISPTTYRVGVGREIPRPYAVNEVNSQHACGVCALAANNGIHKFLEESKS
jgi:hypothetical protein